MNLVKRKSASNGDCHWAWKLKPDRVADAGVHFLRDRIHGEHSRGRDRGRDRGRGRRTRKRMRRKRRRGAEYGGGDAIESEEDARRVGGI